MSRILIFGLMTLGFCHVVPRSSSPSQQSSVHSVVTQADVLKVVDALGGIDALQAITGFTYNGDSQYRSATLSQSYDLAHLDQSIATTGSTYMSYQFNGSDLLSRIDRAYAFDDYWVWALPTLQPLINMSLVVHDAANDQYSCFLQGSNSFMADPASTQGYTDGLVTNYLMRQAHQFALPWLLQYLLSDTSQLKGYEVQQRHTSKTWAAIESPALGLTLLYSSDTGVPYAVRTLEDHVVYGPSTNDLVLTNLTAITVKDNLTFSLPYRLQTVYNSLYVLEDILVDSVSVNPSFPNDYFVGRSPEPDPSNAYQGLAPAAPIDSPEYPISEIHEWYETGLWGGPFGWQYNTSDVVVDYVNSTFPNAMQLYVGEINYVQLLVEHETGFIITDAAPHRSIIILKWLAEHYPDKKVTHVVPSHHHRDHAGGVVDYIRAGATLVVPDVARNYYQQGNSSDATWPIVTYNDTNPFVFQDNLIDFRSYWARDSPHAEDAVFPVVTKANATDSDPFVMFEADVIAPGSVAAGYKSLYVWDLFTKAIRVGIPRNTMIVSAHVHGAKVINMETLRTFATQVGFSYPDLKMADWHTCNNNNQNCSMSTRVMLEDEQS